jgi:hypothetical protein
MSLTRDEFLAVDDITVKEVTVPDKIPAWGGKTLFIKQLSRGQQDTYYKRRFGGMQMKQDARAKGQEITGLNMFGHDAWLCAKSVCDESGKPLFTENDIEKLNSKSGEVIGWIALQIVEFSGMSEDIKVFEGEKTPEDALAEELKNS